MPRRDAGTSFPLLLLLAVVVFTICAVAWKARASWSLCQSESLGQSSQEPFAQDGDDLDGETSANGGVMDNLLTSTMQGVMYKGSLPDEVIPCDIKNIRMPYAFQKPSAWIKERYPNNDVCVISGTGVDDEKARTLAEKCRDTSSSLYSEYVTAKKGTVPGQRTRSKGGIELVNVTKESGKNELQCVVKFNPLATTEMLDKYALDNDLDRQNELLEQAKLELQRLNKIMEERNLMLEAAYKELERASEEEKARLNQQLGQLKRDMEVDKSLINELTKTRDQLQEDLAKGQAFAATTAQTISDLRDQLTTAERRAQPPATSTNGHCGPDSNTKCPTGECCSVFGWCGSSSDHCITHKRSDSTYDGPPNTTLPVTSDMRCGPDNNARCPAGHCCSVFGWCGNGTDHCVTFKRADNIYDGPPQPTPDFRPQSATVRSKLSRRPNDFCMDVRGADGAAGADVIMWTCHGGTNQRWTWDNGDVRAVHSGQCLDVYGWGTHNGAGIIQWPCHGGNNQKWDMDSQWRLRPRHAPTKCLSVHSASPADGTALHIWDCDDNKTEQKWYAQ